MKVSGSGLSFLLCTGELGNWEFMGNIHIFIADELHERLRKVCRHKVTQQKFLEEGIEKLVSEMEVRAVDRKAVEAHEEIYFDNGATVVLTGEDEEVACEGVAISPQYYVPDDKEDE